MEIYLHLGEEISLKAYVEICIILIEVVLEVSIG